MVNQLSEKKTWVGSLVVSQRSAKKIGYVKEIRSNLKSDTETIVVSSFPTGRHSTRYRILPDDSANCAHRALA